MKGEIPFHGTVASIISAGQRSRATYLWCFRALLVLIILSNQLLFEHIHAVISCNIVLWILDFKQWYWMHPFTSQVHWLKSVATLCSALGTFFSALTTSQRLLFPNIRRENFWILDLEFLELELRFLDLSSKVSRLCVQRWGLFFQR